MLELLRECGTRVRERDEGNRTRQGMWNEGIVRGWED